MDGVAAGKVVNPRHFRLEILSAIGVVAGHVLGGVFGVNVVFAGRGGRGRGAVAGQERFNELAVLVSPHLLGSNIGDDQFIKVGARESLKRSGLERRIKLQAAGAEHVFGEIFRLGF